MKKIVVTLVAIVLCVASICLLVGCAQKLNFGKKYVSVKGQIDILTELTAKTSDIGVMDSVMASYYMNKGEYAGKLQMIEDCVLAEESYGIAGRKGSALIAKVNNILVALNKSGKVTEIADKYDLTSEVTIDTTQEEYEVNTDETDYKYVTNKGTVIVGYTEFAPIAFNEGSILIGFDIELAKAVCAELGLTVQFQVINWDTKEFELESKKIDLIWNGLTITDERKAAMEMSMPYMKNTQVAVIRKADAELYTNDKATWAKAIITAEAGSAGESCVKADK